MKRFALGFVIVAVAIGCSAKQKEKFEKVTGTICTGARELQSQIAAGVELIPDETTIYAIGLTYRQVLNACDERDAYLERE